MTCLYVKLGLEPGLSASMSVLFISPSF